MRILVNNGHGIDTKGKRSPDGRLLARGWCAFLHGAKLLLFNLGTCLILREYYTL